MNLPIIDRRTQGKGKNIGNVERFHRRFTKQIKEAAERALDQGNIGDIKGEKVYIPKRDMLEPTFRHSTSGGTKENVHPGNREYLRGDKIARPPKDQNGSGRGGGEGEDDFVFHLSRNQILGILFDGLKLPNMIKQFLLGDDNFKFKNAGIVQSGNPQNLHIVRSFRNALGRRIALNAPREREKFELENLLKSSSSEEEQVKIQLQIDALNARPRVPFIDTIDLRYRSKVKVPTPQAKAVIFRLMDVSFSMREEEKSNAKLFFTLLQMFLEKDYEQIVIVNIRYHFEATECGDTEFFHSTKTGGTLVSSGLEKMKEIINQRFSSSEWNIYGALVSDGDLGPSMDSTETERLMHEILPLCQYFMYAELSGKEEELGKLFKDTISGFKNFSMQTHVERENLFNVFRKFLEKRGFSEEPRRYSVFENTTLSP